MAAGTAAVKSQSSPRGFQCLPPHAQRLAFGVARGRACRQHAKDRRDSQVDPQQKESGGQRFEFEEQCLPAGDLRQRKHGQSKNDGDCAKCSAPSLPRHHRAQTQQLGF